MAFDDYSVKLEDRVEIEQLWEQEQNIHNQVSDGATEINQELAQKLQDRMQELYPMLDINFTNTIGVDNNEQQIIGQANIKAMTILIDAINQKQDTLPHEYAHHYIAWFRNTPIVQEAIKKWGSEEALVQSIGEQVVKQEGEAKTWWDNFTKWMLDLFNNLSSKNKQELTQILTDTFLQGIDLETGQKITAERSKEKSTSKRRSKRII